MRKISLADWLGLLALVIMFGSAFIFTKFAVVSIPPLVVAAGRILIGALVLIAIAVYHGERMDVVRSHPFLLILLAFTGNCLPFFAISWGQQFVESGLAGILMALMPLATILLAHFFVRGEQLNTLKVIGFVLGFLGIVILMRPDQLLIAGQFDAPIIPMLAILLGAFSYAVNSVLAKKLPDLSLTSISAAVLGFAAIMICPLALYYEPVWWRDATPLALVSVLLLGIFPSGLATIIYFYTIRHAGPAFLSQINYLIPVWAVIIGVAFAGEQIGIDAVAALLVILLGIAIAQRARSTSTA